MDIQNFLDHIRDLTDLELALLLSLIASQNILLSTPESQIDDLSSELSLIASEIFDLSYAVVSLDDTTSVEQFGESILDQNPSHDFGGSANAPSSADYLLPHSRLASVTVRAGSIAPSHVSQAREQLDTRTVANIVVAKNFNHAPREVQIAALELVTRRRIYSRTTVHQVPKVFVFIPVVASDEDEVVRLNEHLNDRISMSHYHDPEDGFANLDELQVLLDAKRVRKLNGTGFDSNGGGGERDGYRSRSSSSSSSTTHSQRLDYYQQASTTSIKSPPRRIHHTLITHLRALGDSVTVTPEIRRYMQDIVVFLRFARGVDRGVTPFATTQLVKLARYLAPLHGIDFVTPSLVALAVRKTFLHRIIVAKPERERSVQWGGDVNTAEEIMGGLTPESIVEDVLATIPTPV